MGIQSVENAEYNPKIKNYHFENFGFVNLQKFMWKLYPPKFRHETLRMDFKNG